MLEVNNSGTLERSHTDYEYVYSLERLAFYAVKAYLLFCCKFLSSESAILLVVVRYIDS